MEQLPYSTLVPGEVAHRKPIETTPTPVILLKLWNRDIANMLWRYVLVAKQNTIGKGELLLLKKKVSYVEVKITGFLSCENNCYKA